MTIIDKWPAIGALPRALRRLLPLGLCVVLAAPAAAQLDLPGKGVVGGGTGRSRRKGDLVLPRPAPARGPAEGETAGTAGDEPAPGAPGAAGRLDLPRGTVPAAEAGAPVRPTEGAAAASFIFSEVASKGGSDPGLVRAAEESLFGLGEEGLRAARVSLGQDSPVVLITAARVLLRSPQREDRELVVQRLRTPLPSSACGKLLASLTESDPVLASPELLVELLDHPRGAMRAAAEHALDAQMAPDLLPLLVRALASERRDTRKRALELAARLDDPSVLPLLLARLADPAASNAALAARVLSERAGEEILATLRKTLLDPLWAERGRNYALISLVDHEDHHGIALLELADSSPLLERLGSADALTRGTAAIALAGIGMRSTVEESPWLDLAVTHELVRIVSGEVFHRDFSSLQGHAQRRLSKLTGRSFGSDGAAWMDWWSQSADGFHARRSRMIVGPEQSGSIELSLARGDRAAADFVLVGPEVSGERLAGLSGRAHYFLESGQAVDLVGLLRREGVFDAERPPGVHGRGPRVRELELHVGEQGKVFAQHGEQGEPWFERCVAAAEALRERNRWQRFFDPRRYRDQREFWEAERAWWGDEANADMRPQRLKDLLFEQAGRTSPFDRGPILVELERLYEQPQVPDSADIPRLCEMLRQEVFLGEQARRVLALALRAAEGDAAPAPGGAASPEPGAIDPALAGEVLGCLLAAFGSDASREAGELLEAAGVELARQCVTHDRAFVRAAAVAVLCADGTPAGLELVRTLLADGEREVELAAVRGAGRYRIEALRPEVRLRAVVASGEVRAEALVAMGRLGGEQTSELLLDALTEPDPRLRQAAAEGLAELADPETAAYLVSLFARGPASPSHAAARRGLLRVGQPAWSDLMRMMDSASPASRRDAALLLAEQGVPQAASTLMAILTERPDDARVASELAVLTCVDMRVQPDPAGAWWEWWDEVVHDDALAWLRAALEREGVQAPDTEAMRGRGTEPGLRFLLEVAQRAEEHWSERARRELSRLLGEELRPAPSPKAGPEGRTAWAAELEQRIEERWGG